MEFLNKIETPGAGVTEGRRVVAGVHLLGEGQDQVIGEGDEDVVHLQHVAARSWCSSTQCPGSILILSFLKFHILFCTTYNVLDCPWY